MSLNVVVPWDCTCCIPSCGVPTDKKFVKTLTKIEYLQFYFGEEMTVNASYLLNSRVDHPAPHSFLTSTYQAGLCSDSKTVDFLAPGCGKSTSAMSGTVTATLTRVLRGGGPDEVYTGDFFFTWSAAVVISKVGTTFNLWADLIVSAYSTWGAAFREPPIASGPSTGGTKDFSVQGTAVTASSYGSDNLDVNAVYTSNSTASLSAVVALATPP